MPEVKELHIVIAEDDPDDGEILCESFNKHTAFANVSWVKNGKALMELLHNNKHTRKPDLVLTDINMPLMNGLEAAEEIFKDPLLRDIPIFVYSSANNPLYESKCKELGCMAFFIKPFDMAAYDEIPYRLIYMLKARMGNRV